MNASGPEIPAFPPTFWRDRWREQRFARINTPKNDPPGSFWNDKKRLTEHFIKNLNSCRQEAEDRIAVMGLKAGARVLDIGAGTGTVAIPLAARGYDVVAVEPADAMREALAVYAEQERVGPITVIPKRWEDVGPDELGAPFDCVFASYSLMIQEIGPAIEKMQAVCSGQVHLFWFLTQPYSLRLTADLWPKVHGCPFPGEPTADCLWNALLEMGICANLSVEASCEPAYFPTTDDATKDFCRRLNCTTPEQEHAVREYCGTSLAKTESGYRVAGEALGAHIWWDARGRPAQ